MEGGEREGGRMDALMIGEEITREELERDWFTEICIVTEYIAHDWSCGGVKMADEQLSLLDISARNWNTTRFSTALESVH